jgi:hypothetical protein
MPPKLLATSFPAHPNCKERQGYPWSLTEALTRAIFRIRDFGLGSELGRLAA